MSRYIDAENPIQIVTEYKVNTARMIDDEIDVDDVLDMFSDMIDDFENIPTADVVEVVRCRDCKYRQIAGRNTNYPIWVCQHNTHDICADDFCSFGERSE